MVDGQPRRWGAWVAWVDLEQRIRAEFPESDPLRVMHAVETGDVGYRLRCEPYDGGDLVPDPFSMAWIKGPTIFPHRLEAQDWDKFDRNAGRFRHYPLEVSWPSVCHFLDPEAVESQDAVEPEPTGLTERERLKLKCQHWLEELMRADPTGRSRGTKGRRFADEALVQWPELPRIVFDEAWSAAVASTGAIGWSRSGPAKDTSPAAMRKIVH